MDGGMISLANCGHYFMRVHGNLVKDPSNYSKIPKFMKLFTIKNKFKRKDLIETHIFRFYQNQVL